MRDCDIDLDLSLFKGELADGVFLTKARRNFDTNKIEATYHTFKNGEITDSYVVTYYDNYYNSQFVLSEEIDSILKLIEINDKSLYHRIDIADLKLKDLKRSYTFYEIISWLSATGAVAYGFALANMDNNSEVLFPVLVSSACLMMLGLYARRKNIVAKYSYDYGYDDLFSEVEKKSEGFARNKK
jgi:hypothetical protein